VSVITVGAGGMALATARLVGATQFVGLADVSKPRLDLAQTALEEGGTQGAAFQCNINERSAVDELLQFAASFGDVVSMVHTAGLSPPMGDAASILEVNVLGTLHIGEAFLDIVPSRGRLVNVASSAGHMSSPSRALRKTFARGLSDPEDLLARLVRRSNRVPNRWRAGMAYSLSKSFVIWYSRRRAAAFGERGPRIVSVSPGSTATEMGRLEEPGGAGALAQHSVLRRFASTDELAEVLAFCASEKPGYLTGTDLLVDGGAGACMTWKDKLEMARRV
jgi:NAD(P)-dependent dehydrogenase (short-subunit alcohol dehydrogenase family)